MKRTLCTTVVTTSADETETLGAKLGGRVRAGACIALVGGLGTGKTVFVRGACRGLGVDEDVLSPTFILYEAFDGRLPVVHVDLYRLEHESEIEELGVFDLLGGDTVILAEWGDRSETLLENADAVVTIDTGGGAQHRRVTLEATSEFARMIGGGESWSL